VELLLVQTPPQHWAPVAHTSPFWMHQDEARQKPPEHMPEQHCAPVVQGLLSVLQVVLSGVQAPMVHLPLQHSALLVHTLVSAVHVVGRLQTPPMHAPEQQSDACVHAAPTWKHPAPPVPVPPKPVPVLPVLEPPEPVIVLLVLEPPEPVIVLLVLEPPEPVIVLPVMVVPVEAPAVPPVPKPTLELPHPAANELPTGNARARRRSDRVSRLMAILSTSEYEGHASPTNQSSPSGFVVRAHDDDPPGVNG
jgi:hypothetical protein